MLLGVAKAWGTLRDLMGAPFPGESGWSTLAPLSSPDMARAGAQDFQLGHGFLIGFGILPSQHLLDNIVPCREPGC